MAGWSNRVRIVPGDKGYAYRPGELLVREKDLGRAKVLLGIEFDERRCGAVDLRKKPADRRRDPSLFMQLDYPGDVPAAVRVLRAVDIDAQPNHVFFSNVMANPVYGNPLHGNPVYGNPVYGNPVYGNPVYGNPVYGNPVYGNPVYGNPVYGNPVYGNPVYGNPVYGNPGAGTPGVIGFVPGCPGGEHCCDHDPCTCVSPAGGVSRVYPHPIYAERFYEPVVARRYQLTGLRKTSAVPAFVRSTNSAVPLAVPSNGDWGNSDNVAVVVIDTGWPLTETQARARAVNANPTKQAKWKPNADVSRGDVEDVPDGDVDGRIDPVSGHGMFIAGVISQYAPGVAVQVLKALEPEGDGHERTIADKIHEAIKLDPDILNLSFGTYTLDEPLLLKKAIKAALDAGIIVVASAGNDGVCRPQYPAAFPGVISVGALGPNGPAPFSNWGEWVRASAPGVDVLSGFWEFDPRSSHPNLDDPELFEQWAMWSGTSFAAPVVVAALVHEILLGASDDRQTRRAEAVARLVDHPGLYRIPCYGAVVNPGSSLRAP